MSPLVEKINSNHRAQSSVETEHYDKPKNRGPSLPINGNLICFTCGRWRECGIETSSATWDTEDDGSNVEKAAFLELIDTNQFLIISPPMSNLSLSLSYTLVLFIRSTGAHASWSVMKFGQCANRTTAQRIPFPTNNCMYAIWPISVDTIAGAHFSATSFRSFGLQAYLHGTQPAVRVCCSTSWNHHTSLTSQTPSDLLNIFVRKA